MMRTDLFKAVKLSGLFFLMMLFVTPALSFSRKKSSLNKSIKVMENSKTETKTKKNKKGKGHKKIKGWVEGIDNDKNIMTIRDKKKNLYHIEIKGDTLVNENGAKVDRKNLKKGEKLAIDYDVKNEGKLEAVEIKIKDETEK